MVGRDGKVIDLTAAAVFTDPATWDLPAFYRHLPLPPPAAHTPPVRREPDADLPLADFPLFLATARRRLHPEHFAEVHKQFDAERADALEFLTPRYQDDGFRRLSAAATALALHFSTGPDNFGMIRCGHIAPDGSHLHVPPPDKDPYGPHVFTFAPWHDDKGHSEMINLGPTPFLMSPVPIPMPPAAARLLAAHMAHRRAACAGDADPYFSYSGTGVVERNPTRALREAIMRTCHRLGIPISWLHRSHCRHGDQIGRHLGPHDWLTVRSLTFMLAD